MLASYKVYKVIILFFLLRMTTTPEQNIHSNVSIDFQSAFTKQE